MYQNVPKLGYRHPTLIINRFLHNKKSLKRNTVSNLYIYVCMMNIFTYFCNVPKLRYGLLTLNIQCALEQLNVSGKSN